MKKIIIILIIVLIGLGIGVGIWLCFQKEKKPPEELSLENLGAIILQNTEFKDFHINNFSFKYPDWQKIEIDPTLIWPEEIAEKQEILLYLTNPDGVTMLVIRRKVAPEELQKPFPLIFRKIFEEDRRIMEERGGLTYHQMTDINLIDNEITLELKSVILGKDTSSISKIFIFKQNLYSISINASGAIFEDYRPLADYIINSIRYY